MKTVRNNLNEKDDDNIKRYKRPVKQRKPDPEQQKILSDYFARRSNTMKVVKTTQTPRGQILDWIPIESQTAEGQIANPPPKPEVVTHRGEERKFGLVKFELEDDNAERGPEGTVPVVRKNVERLPHNKTLSDYLSKHGHKTRSLFLDGRHAIQQPEDGGPHDYAFTGQSVTCYGGEGSISAYDPYTWYADEFSLGQIGMARSSKGGLQTVEAGHQEYRDLYGDWVPHLFVFYTTNGYSSQGDNLGGYNRDVDGWVQYSNSIYPEAISSPTSTPGGSQFVMRIKYQLYQGNWWLSCNSHWIGYYPASLFSADGLRSQADSVAFFGEIVDSADHRSATRTDMGSGYWAEDEWPWAGFMSNLQYQSSTGGGMSQYDADSIWATDTSEYDIESHMNSNTTWGSYFWFGGPGAG